ncbi:MAG: hypothetical protein IPK77_00515 [Cellvibrio sp.]|nr:hypothetical protein [Cellvibrio sp.]
MKKVLLVFVLLSLGQAAFCNPLPEPWYQNNLEQYESGIVKVDGEKSEKYGYLKSIKKR